MLGIALSLSPALAQKDLRQEATTAPGFSRIDISSAAAVRFEGTGAPGDGIALHVDGQQAAKTKVDAKGQWRIELADPLAPGDYTAKAVSIGRETSASWVSEDVRIAIPHAALPVYAPSQSDPAFDASRPDAATLRRASELARDAGQAFSELANAGRIASTASDAGLDDQQMASGGDEAAARPSIWSFSGIMDWLASARRDYHEVLVTGLSDPRRWQTGDPGIVMTEERPRTTAPPVDWPEHEGEPAKDYLSMLAGWLHRSSRDYHELVVRELVLRGIGDSGERELARAAMSGTTIADVSDANAGNVAQLTSARLERQAQEQRALEQMRATEELAREKAQRLAEAREREEERAAAAERRDAEERARQLQAAEATARAEADAKAAQAQAEAQRLAELQRQEQEREAQRLAELHRQEQEQAAQRAREEQHREEARQAFALKEYLATRPQDTRPPAGPKPHPVTRPDHDETERAAGEPSRWPEPSRRPERRAAASKPAESQHADAIVAPVPTRIDAIARERLMAAIAAERAASTAGDRARPRRPRPTAMAQASSRQAKAKPVARPNKPANVRNARRKQQARTRPVRHGRCREPRAGRAIRPPGNYVVAYGDTLWGISKRHYGVGQLYRRIRRADGRRIVQPDRIYPCQRVWLPRLNRRGR